MCALVAGVQRCALPIYSVALNGETNDVPVSVAMGDTLDVDVRVRSNDARAPVVLIGPVRADGTPVYGVSSEMDGARPTALGDGRFAYRLQFPALSRSEEHTSELQSLMRITYAVFWLKKTTL